MEFYDQEKLDHKIADPMIEEFVLLFNDLEFEQEANAKGETLGDICMINLALRPHVMFDGGMLRRKFGEFKSLCVIFLYRYKASCQGDLEAVAPFCTGEICIMYPFFS